MINCPHCLRTYQRKVYFDRHVGLCQMLSKTKHERLMEVEEQADTPTLRDLYAAVMSLTEKYSQMEIKFTELSKYASIKKQKLNIVDWLNTNFSSQATDYAEWFKRIRVQQEELDVLFKTDYVGGVIAILKQVLPLDDENRPVRAYTAKDGVFYIYQQADNCWNIADAETFQKLMFSIDKQFMSAFVQWQNENKHRMQQDDFSDTYTQNARKIMGGNNTREQLYSRIKKELYTYLRTELPAMIEYEVTC